MHLFYHNMSLFIFLYQQSISGSRVRFLVQSWAQFLCDIMKLSSTNEEEVDCPSDASFLSVVIGHKHITSKCITVMNKLIVKGWFQGRFMKLFVLIFKFENVFIIFAVN